MNFLKQAERKLGRFAIHNLSMYLVGGQGTVLLISLAMPGFLNSILLQPQAAMAGEWWRLLTFVFTPPGGNPIFAIFALYMLYFMGGALEAHWSAFRYNVYVLIGFAMTIAAAFLFPYSVATNTYITGSIFLAFAQLFPEFQILLFFILPVRMKWLALLTWLYYGFEFLVGDWAGRLLIMASVANFFAFFGNDVFYRMRYGHQKMKSQASAIVKRSKANHTCSSCGVTEKTHPTMDFRYCTKCDPPMEYCEEHLPSHEHTGGAKAAQG